MDAKKRAAARIQKTSCGKPSGSSAPHKPKQRKKYVIEASRSTEAEGLSQTFPHRAVLCAFFALVAISLAAAMALPRWAQAGDVPGQKATITIEVEGYQVQLPTLTSGSDFTLGKPVGSNPAFMADESGKQPLAELVEAKEAQGLTLKWHDGAGKEFDWLTTPVNESITVVGTFEAADYEVRVSFNDGASEDVAARVPRGSSFEQAHGSTPSTPSKQGWEFMRWVDTSDNSTFDFTKPVSKSTSVYALFRVADTSKVEPFDPAKDIPQTLTGRCYIGATWSVHPAQFAVSGFTGGLEGYAGTGTCSLPSAAAPSNTWADYVATLKEVNVEAGEVTYDVTITPPNAARPGGPSNSLGLIGYQTVYMKAVVKKNFGGYLEIAKTSSNPSLSNNNHCYSLEGAVFGVYNQQGTRVAELVTAQDGKTVKSPLLPAGTYTIREEKAPSGFAPASDASAEITSGNTTTATVSDAPQNALISLIGQKVDAETGKPYPLGSACLEGALFRVSHFDQTLPTGTTPASNANDAASPNSDDAAKAVERLGTPKRTWTFKTDNEGRISFDEKHFVEGDEFYRDSNNAVTLPLGTVAIEELQPPTGYTANPTPWITVLTAEGSEEHISAWTPIDFAEQVIRGDLSFTKAKSGTMEHLANVPFRITSHTTGEAHVLVTDENGMASTASSWTPHTRNTNAGTSAKDGIWFAQDAQGNTAEPNDALGALPYDTYDIEELPCKENENTVLAHFTVTISRNNTTLDLGTIDNDSIALEISGEVDKRETPLDESGAFDYTIDYRSTSNTWVDEFTMTDTITCAEEGKANLVSLETPVSFEDYDGTMNVWYRTNFDGEGAKKQSESKANTATKTAQAKETNAEEEPNACATNPYSMNNPTNKRIRDFTSWHIWKEGVSTLESQKLSVADLALGEGEHVVAIAFEHGRVEEGFGTNAPDAKEWDRPERYHETDTTSLSGDGRDTFDLAQATGPTGTEQRTELAYEPAILHMQATDEVLASESEEELWNTAEIDTHRDLELHDEDKDSVLQTTHHDTEQGGIVETLAANLPKTEDMLHAIPLLAALALASAFVLGIQPKIRKRRDLKEAILNNL